MNREPLLQFFQYQHLPEKLQIVSKPFCDLASQIIENVPANIERSQALRKLLESKDCAVRAVLYHSGQEATERLAYDPETNVRA